MKYSILWYGIFLITILLELFVYSFPFTLLSAIFVYLVLHNVEALIVLFFSSFFLDAVNLLSAGTTASFICVALLILVLYQTKFEVRSAPFISLISSIATSFYAYIAGYEFVLWIYIIVPIGIYLLATVLFTSKKTMLYE
jgi:hypothetical protein